MKNTPIKRAKSDSSLSKKKSGTNLLQKLKAKRTLPKWRIAFDTTFDLKHATMNVKTWTQFSSKEDLFVEKFNKCGFVILKFDDTASDDVIEQNVKSLQARLGRLEKTFANEIFSLILRKNYIFHANSVIVFMPKYCTQNRFLY